MSIHRLILSLLACLVTNVSFDGETLEQFLQRRDRWIADEAAREFAAPAPRRFRARVADTLAKERERLEETKEALAPIQKRIDTNRSKPSMAVLVKKDEGGESRAT